MADINTNSTLADITVAGSACKKNYSKLPKVCYFRVQSRNKVGTIKTRHERATGAWALLVSCDDGKGLRLVSDVGYEYGMVIKAEFKTREEAIAAGKEYQAKWHVKTTSSEERKEENERKAREKRMAKLAEDFGMSVEELKAKLAK